MKQIRSDVVQRDQDKPPFREPGVRDLEVVFIENPVAVKKDIQVDDPGTPLLFADSTHPVFDGKEELQQFSRGHRSLDRRDPVDEPVLIPLPHRLRTIEGGTLNLAISRVQADRLEGPAAVGQFIAEVRADSDIRQQGSKSFATEGTEITEITKRMKSEKTDCFL
jgi:hypothetical protein